jgi:hypothetical protein
MAAKGALSHPNEFTDIFQADAPAVPLIHARRFLGTALPRIPGQALLVFQGRACRAPHERQSHRAAAPPPTMLPRPGAGRG